MSRPRTPLEAMIDAACGSTDDGKPTLRSNLAAADLADAMRTLRGKCHHTTEKEGIDIWVIDRVERNALLKALRKKRKRA